MKSSMKPNARSPSKPPLITPSASPPPGLSSRRLVKKQSTASTSFQRSQTPADVNQEREASKSRLLDVWAGLAKRYSRHMDEDDLVDIRTGKITKDNGFWRNAPALEFGALAAPADEDSVVEDDEEGYEQDELDAFAASDDSSDLAEGDSNVNFVSTRTVLDAADAEDLQDFLEAERIRREQCGADVDDGELEETHENETGVLRAGQQCKSVGNQAYGVEADEDSCSEDEEDSTTPIRGGTWDKPELVEDSSGDELDNWTVDESNAIRVIPKNEIDDPKKDVELPPTPSWTGGSGRNRTPQKHGTLLPDTPLSLKRKRVPFNSIHSMPEANFDEERQLPSPSHSPPSYRRTSTKHQTSFTPESPSASCSDYDSGSSPAEKLRYKNRSLRSRSSPISRPPHPGSHMPPSYPSHNNEVYMPIPDPRAQFIIAQAMQQLSALVGMPWQPPSYYPDGNEPHTPSRRHQMPPPGYLYTTPNHKSSQPRVDSNFSHATLPPESPEYDSVQEHSGSPKKRRALVHRSHSRGRRVSFKVGDNSPSKRRQPSPEFEESKIMLHQEEWSSEDVSEYEQPSVGPRYARGQTPGPPSSHPSRRKPRT